MQIVIFLVLWLVETVVVVPVGKPVAIIFRERWREIWISDIRVVDVGGNNLLYAQGKAPGVALVTVTGDKHTRSLLVVVPNSNP